MRVIDVDVIQYVRCFDVGTGEPEVVFGKLREVSEELCRELDKRFQIEGHGGKIELPPENLMWAAGLIISAWLGELLKAKSIWHYGKRDPGWERRLSKTVIPSIVEAFGQGGL